MVHPKNKVPNPVCISELIQQKRCCNGKNLQYGYIVKKDNIFIYKEIQKGAVAKSYMTNGLLNPHV
jgi:hypothetical protein